MSYNYVNFGMTEEEWQERVNFFRYEAKRGNWYTADGRLLKLETMDKFHLHAIAKAIREGRAEDREDCLPYVEGAIKRRNKFNKYWKAKDKENLALKKMQRKTKNYRS